MKYKVEDKVKVREDLEIGKSYDKKTFVEKMKKYKGQIVTIKVVYDDRYRIEEDNQDWYWTDEMLEGVEEEMNLEDFFNTLWKNPEIIINKFSNMYEECQKVNEDLKVELKNKQSEIDFLRGQISVYEKFLKDEEV